MNKIIIPLGEECYTCGSIDTKFNSNGIRKEAYPFDYVGHVFIEKITDKIKNDLELKHDHINIEWFGEEYGYVDKVNEFKYWHDTTHKYISEFTDSDLNTFLDKYNRRYNRLKNNIGNPGVLFLSVNHFDNIYNNIYKRQEVIDLAKVLGNSKLLAINFTNNDENFENIQFVNLPLNKNLEFQESKSEFTKDLNNFINGLNLNENVTQSEYDPPWFN